MDPESVRRRGLAAALLLACVVLGLGVAAVRSPRALGGGKESPWAQAFRGALGSVSGASSQGAGSAAAGRMLPGRPVLPPESPGEVGSPGAGVGRGGPAEQAVPGDECPPGEHGCVFQDGAALAHPGAAAHPDLGSGRAGLAGSAGPAGLAGPAGAQAAGEGLGGGPGAAAFASGGGSSASGVRVKAEDVAKIFSGFIQRLRHEAALAARAQRGAAPPQGHAGGGYDRSQSATAGLPSAEDSPLMNNASFRNLMNVGRDAHYAAQLYEKGMSDGAKDKAGKEFDGNTKILAPIPIERTQGAFNQETIRARGGKAPDQPNTPY